MPPVPVNVFPRRGEQCPVDEFSYKGYSPPKCICNDTHTSNYIPHKNVILCEIYHVMHEMRLPMPIIRILTDSFTHANACENQSLAFHPMTYTIGQSSNILLNLSTPVCLFGSRISRVSPQASREGGGGGGGGVLMCPILLHPHTRN